MFPPFEDQKPLDAAALRAFVADRRSFPWFGDPMSVPFVDAIQQGVCGSMTLRRYVFGTVPITGPMSRPFHANQHSIVEAQDPSWSLSTGRAERRRRFQRWLVWVGFAEVSFTEDKGFTQRFCVRAADKPAARGLLSPSLRGRLVGAKAVTSMAWSGDRVMVHASGRLAGVFADAFCAEALDIIEHISSVRSQ